MTDSASVATADTHRLFVLTAVGVGTFMSALDASVVNMMLPIIGRELGASGAAIEWVVTIYLLVVSALLLGVGRLGDMRGTRDVYIAGFAVFVLASAACGASGVLATARASFVVAAVVAAVGVMTSLVRGNDPT